MALLTDSQPIIMSKLVGEKITDKHNTYLVLNHEHRQGREFLAIVKDGKIINIDRTDLILHFKYGDSFWNVDFPFTGGKDE